MADLTQLSIKETLALLHKGEVSAKEVTEAHLKKAEAENGKYNAFTEITRAQALQQAANADEKYRNKSAGLIEGIPLAVKNLYCTKGVETTACSKILKGFKPEYESTVTKNLFAQGGVMIGKTNMDEFAMGSANINSCDGPVINPWKRKGDDNDLTPGGSSGGSAAAVAARHAMGSLGSDTGGSIRQPAAFTGTVGIKPTYGRCSRYGMIAFASSLDQAGVFARSVYDAALLLEAIAGYDPKDSTSANKPVPQFSQAAQQSIKGKRVGIPKEYHMDGMPEEITKQWQAGAEWLKAEGAEIVEISLPHAKYALPAYYIIAPAEASSNLARYDGVRYGLRVAPDNGGINDMYEATRAAGFGDEVKRRIMIGTYVLSAGFYDAYYTKALKVRRVIAQDFKEAFKQVDAILTPATPSPAFALGERVDDPVKMYLNDVFTVTANLAGLPGVSVPSGLSQDGLPLGLQVIGNVYDEMTMLAFASAIERAAGFKPL
jgi:aspartyl-tRNA(Asn)/glutamyl-tRNA(Gln) amidotransferase subunit A